MFRSPVSLKAFSKDVKIPIEEAKDLYHNYCENYDYEYGRYLDYVESMLNDENIRDDFADSLKTPNKIAERLLEARKREHLTQVEVAEKLDVSKQSMYNYEKGNTIPPTQLMEKLANLYGVESYELYTGLPSYAATRTVVSDELYEEIKLINSRLELITKNKYDEYAKAMQKTIGKSPTERDWLIETSTQFLNDLTLEQLYEIRKIIILNSILNIKQ